MERLGISEEDDSGRSGKEGYEALMAGKDHVIVVSFKNRVQAAGFALPDALVAAAQAGIG